MNETPNSVELSSEGESIPVDNTLSTLSRRRNMLIDRVVGGGFSNQVPKVPGYTFTERIGAGGMGEVWLAQSSTGEAVAIKLMRQSHAEDDGSRGRFLREARAAQSIEHPGVVRALEYGVTAEDQPFLVLEHVEGRTLRDVIESHAPLTWSQAHPLITQIAQGLEALHAMGIVHRDVKPSNIIVGGTLDEPRCTIIDLGLVRALKPRSSSTELTFTGQVIGTPSYLSPEVLRGDPVDGRCDLYSLGCVAYELLEGARPYEAMGMEELFVAHLLRPAPRPKLPNVSQGLRDQVWAILARCLNKQPKERLRSMGALVNAVQAVRRGGTKISHSSGTRKHKIRNISIGVISATALIAAGSVAVAVRPEASLAPPPPPKIVDVVTGIAVSCALARTGALRCWGSDSKGRMAIGSRGSNIGDNEHPRDRAPIILPEGRVPQRMSSGAESRHVCMLWDEGRVSCWGSNTAGQLGLGNTHVWGDDPPETLAALPDLGLRNVVEIETGQETTCVRFEAGDVVCWGQGESGERGDGTTQTVGDDEPIDDLRPVAFGAAKAIDIALGRSHGCALLDDGSVRCWGANNHGQLGIKGRTAAIGDGRGDGFTGQRPDDPALAVQGLEGLEIASVHAGSDRSCVVTRKGGVRCWGHDAHGKLGYPQDAALNCREGPEEESEDDVCDLDVPPPFDLPIGEPVSTMSIGRSIGCALDLDGGVHCWGSVVWGMTGSGQAENREESVGVDFEPASSKVVDLGDTDGDGRIDPVAQISSANFHSCARMVHGSVRCWGHGTAGRLGYRSTDNVGDNETPADYYAKIDLWDVIAF